MPCLPPCFTIYMSAGLLNILGPLLLLLLALFSNSGAPPASLHFSRTYPVQVYTQWNSIPFYVKDKGVFLREYPNNSIKRQKFEHMVPPFEFFVVAIPNGIARASSCF